MLRQMLLCTDCSELVIAILFCLWVIIRKKNIMTLETQRGIAKKEMVTVGCPYLDALAKKLSRC